MLLLIERLPDPIAGFVRQHALTMGDAMFVGYVEGACGRVCPEPPSPVVDIRGVASAPARPINSQEDSLQVLAALSCIDHVVPFDEDTPHELICAVRPHVFVKGGDRTRDRLPEAGSVGELGGEVRILSFVADRSTTGLIEKNRAVEVSDRAAAANGSRR
jgi:bifunctional ADP-heptose synthase (sugar kinase/adenylyltransferase)